MIYFNMKQKYRNSYIIKMISKFDKSFSQCHCYNLTVLQFSQVKWKEFALIGAAMSDCLILFKNEELNKTIFFNQLKLYFSWCENSDEKNYVPVV